MSSLYKLVLVSLCLVMDFRTPERGRYNNPRPTHRAPVATVPPPLPNEEAPKEDPKPKRRLKKVATGKLSWKKITAIVVLALLVAWLTYGYLNTKNQLEN